MTIIEQARNYVAAIPGAVSGNGGHSQTFTVAVALVNGFDLPESDALAILREYNQRCDPPWSEKELAHKIREAITKPHDKPKGHLRSRTSARRPDPKSAVSTMPPLQTHANPPPAKAQRVYELDPETKLPAPIPDGTRALIRAAFREGEGVRLCHARFNEEDKEVPRDSGACLSREEWLAKLDACKGNPNGIYSSMGNGPKPGIFVTVNPMKVGGSSDSDVTAFRHCLVEFDSISRQEQWNLYEKSRIPCVAVIDSGGKSIHAWVKVDAKDRREYDERVKLIYQHFEAYGLDAKNKNPSRFSRLPNCVRRSNRQELLALNVGAESFTEWVKELEHESLPKGKTLKDFMAMDTSNDPNCVIGFRDGKSLRYLCKGKSAWVIGPSGVGKSSLTTEFAIGWALGMPVFGIAPARPLKSLIIQAENDDFDLAEMMQGIAKSHSLDPEFSEVEFNQVNSNVVFVTETTTIGQFFVERLHRHLDRHKPDIVWIDPLLSFAGIDVAKQEQVSQFLRTLINPVLEATGAVLIGIHHTGKPKGSKETANYTAIDHAYSGIGSSELVNWARAVMVLRPVDDHRFELKLAKRGGRAGASHPDGEWTSSSIWLRHARSGIRWEQIMPPEDLESEANGGKKDAKPKKLNFFEKVIAKGLNTFLEQSPPAGESERQFSDRLAKWCVKHNIHAKPDSIRKTWIESFIETVNPHSKKTYFRQDEEGKIHANI